MKLDNIFYVPKAKMTYRIAETVVDGFHINLGGYVFERVSKRPQGRSIKHNLLNSNQTERWVIYN